MACSVLVTLAVFMSSCKQDLTVQPTPSVSPTSNDKIVDLNIPGVEVKDNVLYFKDGQSFKNAQEVLNSTNLVSYKAFCDKIGFKSQLILLNEAIQSLEKVKTVNEFEDFKKANSDIFTYEKGYIDLKMESQLMQKFVGKSGTMYINNDVYFYDEKGYIFVKGGDSERLSRAKISRESSEQEGIMVGTNVIQVQTRAACAVEQNSGWVNGGSNRRGILYVNVEFIGPIYAGNNAYNVSFYSVHRGRAQKKSIFGWNDYSTDHTIIFNDVSKGLEIINNTSQIVTQPHNGAVSLSNTNIIEWTGFICIWNNVDYNTAISASNQRFPFISINDSYSNQGGVSINLSCQ